MGFPAPDGDSSRSNLGVPRVTDPLRVMKASPFQVTILRLIETGERRTGDSARCSNDRARAASTTYPSAQGIKFNQSAQAAFVPLTPATDTPLAVRSRSQPPRKPK